MSIKDLASKIKQPCADCPYKLGLVQTLTTPCPQCKSEGYQMYKRFKQFTSRGIQPTDNQ